MQVCTSLQGDNHASTTLFSFLQAGCLSCHTNNSIKALKAQTITVKKLPPSLWHHLPIIQTLHTIYFSIVLNTSSFHTLQHNGISKGYKSFHNGDKLSNCVGIKQNRQKLSNVKFHVQIYLPDNLTAHYTRWRHWQRGGWTFCVCKKLGGGAIAGSLVL